MTTEDLSFALLLLKTISSDAVCELWDGCSDWRCGNCHAASICRNELETCPNRHRYRDALFRGIADAM
jgi:hypothetical protein